MDMRTPRRTMAEVRQLKERGMEVCGLKLCPGTPYLASGEDNGRVSIWDLRMVKLYTIINAHTACAKVTTIKPVLSGNSKKRQNKDLNDIWLLNEGRKYCRMLRNIFDLH